ncbi:DUF1403 family protein [Hoeflea sp.]|uniref:DUF1403 family protein n=1 Tax=Hoeflea sp. TaxID=1940281 RepID=UPI0019C6604A|nr:DUF1403 family protein [Hoeflea sp.]
MDSLPASPSSLPIRLSGLPAWGRPNGRDVTEADAAFAAGIALKSLEDLVRLDPVWAGCWRSRQALKCAAAAVQLMGRNEDEHALRDAVLLTAPGSDPGPAGNLFLAMQKVSARTGGVKTAFVEELAGCFALRWDDALASVPDLIDAATQSGRAAPFAAADMIDAICAVRPDAEGLAFTLADFVLANKLNWPKPGDR